MIKFYKPNYDDLWFRMMFLGDDKTMEYNHSYGGTISFSKDKWALWYEKWITNASDKRFYRYVKHNDTFVGEACYHYDEIDFRYYIDVIIYYPYRNKGFGTLALIKLCDIAKEHGITELYDSIVSDNASVNIFKKNGFYEVERTSEYILVKKDLL